MTNEPAPDSAPDGALDRMADRTGPQPPRLGAWARAGEQVGLVAAVGEATVTLFHPGQRRNVTVAAAALEPVPAGAVTITVSLDLPLAHGVGEAELRRWVASLVDDAVRETAVKALTDAGIDVGAALPSARFEVRRMEGGGAICLCGTRTDAPEGAALACPACKREAVAAPPSSG